MKAFMPANCCSRRACSSAATRCLEPSLPFRRLGFLEQRPLTLFALRLQLAPKLLEALRTDAPEMTELEIDHRVGGGQWIRQQSLEALELLLSALDRALLVFQLVQELESLLPKGLELPLDVRAVPIELQQLLGRRGALPLSKRRQHQQAQVL